MRKRVAVLVALAALIASACVQGSQPNANPESSGNGSIDPAASFGTRPGPSAVSGYHGPDNLGSGEITGTMPPR